MKNIEIVLGCLHSPFHNKKLWYGILNLIKDLPISGISLIGDILDLNSLSDYDRGKSLLKIDNEDLDLRKEYKRVTVFDELDEVMNLNRRHITKRFLYGNHEDRYLRAIRDPDKAKIIAEPPEEYFRLRERGWVVKTNWKDDYYLSGDHLELFHGQLLGVNPAKRQLDKLKKSCMFVHSHRAGTYHDGNMASYNIGCLVDVTSPVFGYAVRLITRNWVMGFALVTIDDDGFYHCQPITAYNDIFYFNGKSYGK